jgi:polyphosphate kinase
MHRDLYLDTADDTLRRRGILCRLRFRDSDERVLSLRIATGAGARGLRVDAAVRSSDLARALAENNAATRRLRALVDPTLLQSRLELEVDRLTRTAHPDLFRRPRFELHYDRVTVRRNGIGRTFHQLCGHRRRGSAEELARLAGALEAEHGLRSLGSDPRDHAGLLIRWARDEIRPASGVRSDEMQHDLAVAPPHPVTPELLSPELSLLAFQRRVLALAEDPATPLRARLRFLGIVTSNLDELYMGRVPELRRSAREGDAAHERGADGMNAIERLALVERAISELTSAQARCAEQCLRDAAGVGVRLMSWAALDRAEREPLRDRCREEINPGLTPLAMTLSPGHPLPHLPHLGLSLAVVFRRAAGAEPHLAELELPPDVPRLLPVPGRSGAMITMEEVLRANLDLLYPTAHVDGAYLFRVTRGGDLALDEENADDLLVAVARAAERRPDNPAVRLEVEHTMPVFVGELVLESLRRDALAHSMDIAVEEVQVVEGLLDLRCLSDLPVPVTDGLEYEELRSTAVAPEGPMLDTIRERDLLVHHPFESFDSSVERFIREAAADPEVSSIKITLYRVGDPSPIVESLLAAAHAGKRVAAMVELKARFDETHNVGWARALERAGGHVVYGLVGLKVHAKVALVVRREQGKLRRYVHIGTGNYSARSGRQYTDLSLFSARDALTADVADLFNELTGSARAPRGLRQGALVAPHQLLPALLGLIEREASHARAGRPAGIRIKVNGLSDTEIVRALYLASNAGVRIELVVRGICTLRPGVPGRSANIRVVSVVGRFLEHSRIYRFENGGAPEYLIGSSDLRPRNLRRRVELLVPVLDAGHRARLDRILALYLDDPTGWDLALDGAYIQRSGGAMSASAQSLASR